MYIFAKMRGSSCKKIIGVGIKDVSNLALTLQWAVHLLYLFDGCIHLFCVCVHFGSIPPLISTHTNTDWVKKGKTRKKSPQNLVWITVLLCIWLFPVYLTFYPDHSSTALQAYFFGQFLLLVFIALPITQLFFAPSNPNSSSASYFNDVAIFMFSSICAQITLSRSIQILICENPQMWPFPSDLWACVTIHLHHFRTSRRFELKLESRPALHCLFSLQQFDRSTHRAGLI